MGPKVYAVTNQKGGVGKSTTTVNLGAALGRLGYKVLLVDLDPQGNSTSGFGIDKSTIDACIYDILQMEAEIDDVIIPLEEENLWLVPATLNLAGSEIELVSAVSRETRLKNAIAKVGDRFDYVLIDCPPSLGLLTMNALTASDGVVVPIQCEFYALEGIAQLMEVVGVVRKHLNPELDIKGVVLTLFDSRLNLSSQVAEEVKAFFENRVYETVIPRNVKLAEAPSFGQSVMEYDPRSAGAEAYLELAKEVACHEKEGVR